jgi:hypothetical protein
MVYYPKCSEHRGPRTPAAALPGHLPAGQLGPDHAQRPATPATSRPAGPGWRPAWSRRPRPGRGRGRRPPRHRPARSGPAPGPRVPRSAAAAGSRPAPRRQPQPQGAEAAAGVDGGQLPVVADQHHLRPSMLAWSRRRVSLREPSMPASSTTSTVRRSSQSCPRLRSASSRSQVATSSNPSDSNETVAMPVGALARGR